MEILCHCRVARKRDYDVEKKKLILNAVETSSHPLRQLTVRISYFIVSSVL